MYQMIKLLQFVVLLIFVSISHCNITMVSPEFYIHVTANLNSFGPPGSQTRRKTYNLFKDIQLEFGKPPNSAGFQECRFFDVRLAPFYSEPVGTDSNVIIFQDNHEIKRGVCTYADPETTVLVESPCDDVEMVTTIHEIMLNGTTLNRNRGCKPSSVAFINCYRNQTVVSSEYLRETILKQINILNGKYHVRKLVVHGDFNDPDFYIPDLIELHHPNMYHKADSTSKKSKIDKVFSNMENIKIAEVYETLENKVQNEENDLGHKAIVIMIGKREEWEQRDVFINRMYEAECTDFNGVTPWSWELLVKGGREAIDLASDYLINVINDLVTRSKIKSHTTKQKRRETKALDLLEKHAKSTGAKMVKHFHSWMAEFKYGIELNTTEVPPLKEFALKLQKKLDNLNIGNPELIKNTVYEIWGEKYKYNKVVTTFPTKAEAKKIVMSTSNSGARDCDGLSLKMTKTFLQRSKLGWNMYYELTKAMAWLGYIPDRWKNDEIMFMYKKKGLRSDPGNWRPITIAPSLGKHNEKLMQWQFRFVDDGNVDNNAYKPDCSCITAILNVSEHFKQLRKRAVELAKQGKRLVVIFQAEDISGAFESVDHDAIDWFCDAVFDSESGDWKIKEQVRNYLTRNAVVIDRKSGDQIELVKKLLKRSTPQGSILSPQFWRIFDMIFTTIYKKSLDELKKSNPFFDGYFHCAYSDDHVTVISLVFDENEFDEIILDVMAVTASTCRKLLDSATKSVGCGINAKKSELLIEPKWSLVAPEWGQQKPELKNQVTWLGFSIMFTDEFFLIFTEDKMEKRLFKVKEMMNDSYQYLEAVYVRWKIWRTYLSPVLEWYLPAYLSDPSMRLDSTKPANKLEIFQQFCLARVLGVPHTVNRDKLNELLGERSVKEKAGIVATRLSRYCARDVKQLKWKDGAEPVVVKTRSRNEAVPNWEGVDGVDLGDWAHLLAEEYKTSDLFERTVPKFDDELAIEWAKIQNNNIRRIMLEKGV